MRRLGAHHRHHARIRIWQLGGDRHVRLNLWWNKGDHWMLEQQLPMLGEPRTDEDRASIDTPSDWQTESGGGSVSHQQQPWSMAWEG